MPLDKRFAKLPFWLQFAINILLLYGIWIVFYKFLRDWWLVDYLYEEMIYYMTKIQLHLAGAFLKLLGYTVEIYCKVITINGSNGVLLDRGCLGRNVLGVFLGFILAFPSSFKKKIGISVIGVIVFIILNVLRISALAIIELCCHQYLQINHHYVFKIIIYAIMFLMWAIWLRSLRESKQQQEP